MSMLCQIYKIKTYELKIMRIVTLVSYPTVSNVTNTA